jgi:hypothetical protein
MGSRGHQPALATDRNEQGGQGFLASCLMLREGAGRQDEGRFGLIRPKERLRVAMAGDEHGRTWCSSRARGREEIGGLPPLRRSVGQRPLGRALSRRRRVRLGLLQVA